MAEFVPPAVVGGGERLCERSPLPPSIPEYTAVKIWVRGLTFNGESLTLGAATQLIALAM